MALLWRLYSARFGLWRSLAPLALKNVIESHGVGIDPSLYSVSPSSGQIGHRKQEFDNQFYWDGNFGFILRVGATPIACIAFNFEFKSVCIVQLQGAKGLRREIRTINAERVLVDLVLLLATWTKLKEAHMLSGKDNPWRHHVPIKFLLERYDRRAVAHGMSWDARMRRFVRNMFDKPFMQSELPQSIRRIM